MTIQCWYCHREVSTQLPEETIFRAIAVCPTCIAREEDEKQENHESLLAWEKAMMEACGEDGIESVSEKIYKMKRNLIEDGMVVRHLEEKIAALEKEVATPILVNTCRLADSLADFKAKYIKQVELTAEVATVEVIWKDTMRDAIGKDDPESVAKAIADLKAQRDKLLAATQESLYMICTLCKRLNPQHTGSPDTCDCGDVRFLREAIKDAGES